MIGLGGPAPHPDIGCPHNNIMLQSMGVMRLARCLRKTISNWPST